MQWAIGFAKSVVLINRINRFFGTNWKAVTEKFGSNDLHRLPEKGRANIFISCVDTVAARFDIANAIAVINEQSNYTRNNTYYWMDLGNAQCTGQVILSTIEPIKQPSSELFETVSSLPIITEEFKGLLEEQNDNIEPSCSLAEALEKQDLYINSTLANMGASLLWNLFRNGMTANRGFFLNLKDFRTQPIKAG